jgi:[ribosomal protein S5]-alanine N-acetyltransferase
MKLVKPELILKTKRLVLEPIKLHHAANLFLLLQDERIYRYIPQNPPISIKLLEQRYQKLQSRLSPDRQEAWLNWAIRLKNVSEYIGRVEASVLPNYTAEIAYELSPTYWNQGYATEACQQILSILFVEYLVKKVKAQVDTRNQASMRLLEKLKFTVIAHQKNADFFKNSPIDEYTYQLLVE